MTWLPFARARSSRIWIALPVLYPLCTAVLHFIPAAHVLCRYHIGIIWGPDIHVGKVPAPVLDLVGLVDDACTTAGPSPSSVSTVSEPVSQATSPVSACAPQDAVKTADAVPAAVPTVAAVASVPAAAAVAEVDEKKTSQTQDYKAVMLPLQFGELSAIPNHHWLLNPDASAKVSFATS